tara:strand:+ start:552 stop:788 length:237 start_codon:yes stop_codon:yes gene_type:complete
MTWTQTSATSTTTWIESEGGAQVWTEVVSPTAQTWLETQVALVYYTTFDSVNLLWDGSNATSTDNLIWNLFQYTGVSS